MKIGTSYRDSFIGRQARSLVHYAAVANIPKKVRPTAIVDGDEVSTR